MQRGLTDVEGIAVIVCMLVLGAVVVIVARGRTPDYDLMRSKTECMNNMRNIVGLLETAPYPEHGGADLILYLVRKGEIDEAHLGMLFCPGDTKESLKNAGGASSYKALELGKPNGQLTSYAGRNLRDARFGLKRPIPQSVVLVADDSEDHHKGLGIIVGLTGGAAKWRDKIDTYDTDGELVVGPTSSIEELRCLKVD